MRRSQVQTEVLLQHLWPQAYQSFIRPGQQFDKKWSASRTDFCAGASMPSLVLRLTASAAHFSFEVRLQTRLFTLSFNFELPLLTVTAPAPDQLPNIH